MRDEKEVRVNADRLPREIWVLVFSGLIIAMGYGLVAPILPAYARSFDVGVTAASFVISAFALARLLFAPAGGRLVERFGQRRVYMAGLLIVAASSVATALAQTYWQLVIVRGLGGIGSTIFTIAAMGLLVRLAPSHQRGRASGLWGTSFMIGNIAGPTVGAATVGLGMRVPFVLYAAMLLIAVLVVAFLLPEPQDDAEAPAEAPDAAPASVGALRAALRHPAYRAAIVSNFVHHWTNMGVRVALVPLFAGAVALSVGDEEAAKWLPGIALTAFALGNILVVNPVGIGSDRWGRRPFLVVGLGAGAVLTALFGWADSPMLLLALSLLAGAAAGTIASPQQAAVADVVTLGPRGGQGRVLAAFQMAGDAGQICGPVLAGLIVDYAGYPQAFAASGLLLAVGAVAWFLARDARRR